MARRLTAQLLAGTPAEDPLAVAQRLLAIQGQDPRGARLAIRARSAGVCAADIDRALTEERSLLITTLNRGTLHLIHSEDYPLLQSLTTPQLRTTSATRLAQAGLDAAVTDRALRVIERALAGDGPLPRAALRERLERAGVPGLEQGMVQLVFRASIEGLMVRGPMAGRQQAFTLVRDWLPRSVPPPRDVALAELARRYLAGHGPADEHDLARWAGIGLRDARAGLSAIAARLRCLPGGLVELAATGRAAPLPAPRLLGAFEPLLLGWTSRREVLGDNAPRIVRGGMFGGFALAHGRAVAAWRLAAGAAEIEPFAPLDDQVAAALERDASALRQFL
ncbi:MAG: winged helix DNA-binding domain-containing protein [Solirubrobacteraceae bacterium]